MRLFLPDYGHLHTAAGYRPMSTLYQGEALRLCFYPDGPKFFPTAGQAREAAKEYVAAQINKIRAATLEPALEPTPKVCDLGAADWLAGKGERHARDVAAAFKPVFTRSGRMVPVENRHRRRA